MLKRLPDRVSLANYRLPLYVPQAVVYNENYNLGNPELLVKALQGNERGWQHLLLIYGLPFA